MNAIVLINRRAKQLQKANKRKAWQDCIQQASKEYRAGSLGKVKKVKRPKQTGTSNTKRDKQRKAKPPGKRKSKSGRVYTERRKNRTDAPGKITGLNVPAQIKAEMEQVHIAEAKMWQLRNTTTRGMTSFQKAEHKRQKKYWQQYKVQHKKNISNLKRLI